MDDFSGIHSGALVPGVDNSIKNLTRSLLRTSPNQRCCCALAIINASGRVLHSPRRWVYSGSVGLSPLKIASNQTGFVLATKNSNSIRGTTAVLTYAIEGYNCRYLQVTWSVPSLTLQNTWVNVNVGNEVAEEHLLWDMYNDRCGYLMKATGQKQVINTFDFSIELYLSQGCPLELIVDLNPAFN